MQAAIQTGIKLQQFPVIITSSPSPALVCARELKLLSLPLLLVDGVLELKMARADPCLVF